jgi:hypothetical protein
MSWPVPWGYEVPPLQPRLIVDSGEFELLLASFNDVDAKPEAIEEVLVVSGHLVNSKGLVAFLAAEESASPPERLDPLTDLVATLCQALRDYSCPGAMLRARWTELKASGHQLEAVETSVNLLLDYYCEVEEAYLSCAIVQVAVTASRRPAWWRSKSKLVMLVERWKRTLAYEVAQGRAVDGLLTKANSMLATLRFLEKSNASRSSEVFVVASAFCFCCAVVQSKRRCPGVALMMLNRATEFILTAFALEQGLATVAIDSVSLSSGESVGVSSLLKLLVDAGRVSGTFLNGHPFGVVNTSRNQLGYTHGLAQVSQADVEAAIHDTRVEIRGLDPSLGWWAKVKDIQPEMADATRHVAAALDYDRLVERVSSDGLLLQISELKG